MCGKECIEIHRRWFDGVAVQQHEIVLQVMTDKRDWLSEQFSESPLNHIRSEIAHVALAEGNEEGISASQRGIEYPKQRCGARIFVVCLGI